MPAPSNLYVLIQAPLHPYCNQPSIWYTQSYTTVLQPYSLTALQPIAALPLPSACQVQGLVKEGATHVVMKDHKTEYAYGSVAKPIPAGDLAHADAADVVVGGGGSIHGTLNSIGTTSNGSGSLGARASSIIAISSCGSLWASWPASATSSWLVPEAAQQHHSCRSRLGAA